MPDPLATINLRETPQTVQADPRQVRNTAGGYTFTIDDLARLRRFLVLGTTGGTYYASERDLTRQNADLILNLARTRGTEVVAELLTISQAGRAPKNDQALFTLAAVLSLGDTEAKAAAKAALPLVARTGTHLFQFVGYAQQFRGWGRGLRGAVASWYEGKDADALAYQVVKYRQRAGWTHRDVLRSAHPRTADDRLRAVYDFACGRDGEGAPGIIDGFRSAQTSDNPAATARLVESYNLSWEMLQPGHLNAAVVWEALLAKGLPQTALMRQLPRLTNLGLLTAIGPWTARVATQLTDRERLRKAHVHPVNVLVAQRTYASGRSVRGEGTWTPTPAITDALDAGFYAAFGAVEPAGKRTRLALDVSGSMTSPVSGLPLSCREASAALAMVTAATEPAYDVVGFTGGGGWDWRSNTMLSPLDISPRRRLDDVLRSISNLPFGGTDCALPIVDATQRGLEFDTFVVYTDNETWAGVMHPHQALRQYRQHTGINARLIVVGMTATQFTIADPTDPGMLDVAGFDSAVPNLIGDFSRGSI